MLIHLYRCSKKAWNITISSKNEFHKKFLLSSFFFFFFRLNDTLKAFEEIDKCVQVIALFFDLLC